MKACVVSRAGGSDVLEFRQMPKPTPEADEGLVRVSACGINPVDYKIRRDGYWANLIFPAILGWDVSGVVEEVGSAVADFKPGDEVFYNAVLDAYYDYWGWSRPGLVEK